MEFLSDFISLIWHILRDWWWVFLPPVFFGYAKKLYLWYKTEKFFSKVPWVMLEIRLPQEVEKTPKAMEAVLNGFHGLHDPPTWKDKWVDGRTVLYSMSLELVSIDGVMHFYIYVPRSFKNLVETNIYAEYPEAEIFEVEDYVKNVPQDMPNKNWDMWGTDLVLSKESAYPLRTYTFYESESTVEEKRVDPLSALLEHFSSLKDGEQLWMQILIRPTISEIKWQDEGRKIVDKMMGKEEKTAKTKPALGPLGEFATEMGTALFGQEAKPEEKPQKIEWGLFRFSPGEQDLAKAIENKISKLGFQSNVRFIYLGRNDVFSKAKGVSGTFGVLKQFAGYNSFRPDKITKTKVTFFMVSRRTYFRKRRLLRFYRMRFFPTHHQPYVLNSEELATLFHFPGRMVAPAPFVPRIFAKKGEPPPTLPIG